MNLSKQEPRFVEFEGVRLVGNRMRTTIAENRTFELWSGFAPRISEIGDRSDANMYSVQVMDKDVSMAEFSPSTPFGKWAAVASNDANTPAEMEVLHVEAGTYAVFVHKGVASTIGVLFNFIFMEWMPSSKYEFDNRPQFEIMAQGYNPNDPAMEEEVWIPVKIKE